MQSGIVTVMLANLGKAGHQVALARLDDTSSIRRVMSTLVASKIRTTGIHWVGGVENALPGKTSEATLALEPGRYVLVCEYPDDDGHAHVSKGMIRPLIVVKGSSSSDTMLPAARATIHLSDYRIDVSLPLVAAPQRVRVQNDGPHRHHLTVGRVVGRATLADIDKWDGKSLPAPLEDIGAGAAVLDPGQASVITLDLKAGRYLLACVLSDTADAKPHYLLGMEKLLIVR
ncbi:MAG: hypothetical protein H0U66_11410 [Gemmatimonadaceae bacterium]|nr:hypothetical protein [Gemmatimonadaceae bacterium]